MSICKKTFANCKMTRKKDRKKKRKKMTKTAISFEFVGERRHSTLEHSFSRNRSKSGSVGHFSNPVEAVLICS